MVTVLFTSGVSVRRFIKITPFTTCYILLSEMSSPHQAMIKYNVLQAEIQPHPKSQTYSLFRNALSTLLNVFLQNFYVATQSTSPIIKAYKFYSYKEPQRELISLEKVYNK